MLDDIPAMPFNKRMKLKVSSKVLYGIMLSLGAGYTLFALVTAVLHLGIPQPVFREISLWVFMIVAVLFFYNRQLQKKEAARKAEEEEKALESAAKVNSEETQDIKQKADESTTT